MPKRSLKCSPSGWVAEWRISRLESAKADGALRQVLEDAGKDMVATNCKRGSSGQRWEGGSARGSVAMECRS
jgi:hypothetical protein